MYKTTSILILTAIAAMILSIFGLRGETDIAIVNYLFEKRNIATLNILFFVTLLASSGTALITILSVAVSSLVRKYTDTAIAAVSGFFATELAMLSLKQIFQRSRPDIAFRAISENSFSFPSGHATTAAFVFGFLAYLIFLGTKNTTTRVATLSSVIVMTIAVDLSRVYLGVHYTSDVIAGNLLGFLVLLLTIALHTRWRKQHTIIGESHSRTVIISISLCIMTATLWFLFGSTP
ncbi:MAG: phosphatase PAP2 family protein [Patescibacteria group bacterium]